jgi:hypothetical protein
VVRTARKHLLPCYRVTQTAWRLHSAVLKTLRDRRLRPSAEEIPPSYSRYLVKIFFAWSNDAVRRGTSGRACVMQHCQWSPLPLQRVLRSIRTDGIPACRSVIYADWWLVEDAVECSCARCIPRGWAALTARVRYGRWRPRELHDSSRPVVEYTDNLLFFVARVEMLIC